MMKKLLLISSLLIADIAVLLIVFYWELWNREYLYPELREFNIFAFGLLFGLLLITDFIIVLIVRFAFSKKTVLKSVAIPLFSIALLAFVWLDTIFGALASSNWKSSTTDQNNFGVVDEYFDRNFSIAGLKMSEIMALDHEKVNNYQYEYYNSLASAHFYVSFDMKLTAESYNQLISTFSSSPEIVRGDLNENKGAKVTFVLSEEKYDFASVDNWEIFSIVFSSETKTVHFALKGECYT